MEFAEVALKRVLHSLNVSDLDKAREAVTLFQQQQSAAARVRLIQALVFSCEYVMYLLSLHSCSVYFRALWRYAH